MTAMAQFGPGFDRSLKNRNHIAGLLGKLAGLPLAVEFLNNTWAISTNEARSGTYSAASSNNTHSSTSTLSLTIEMGTGQVCYWRYGQSENECNFFCFNIDGTRKETVYGDRRVWAQMCFPVTAGPHTLQWQYSKDGSVHHGLDRFWIDDVQFPCPQ